MNRLQELLSEGTYDISAIDWERCWGHAMKLEQTVMGGR
jgi:hypothetical protein